MQSGNLSSGPQEGNETLAPRRKAQVEPPLFNESSSNKDELGRPHGERKATIPTSISDRLALQISSSDPYRLPSSKSGHPIIDLVNDSNPNRSLRRLESVMDDGGNYREIQIQSTAFSTRNSRPPIIDLVNETCPSTVTTHLNENIKPRKDSDHFPTLAPPCSPPLKRKRLQNSIETAQCVVRATSNINTGHVSQKSQDGGLITYNLLELIDQFTNANILTINGNSSHSKRAGLPNHSQGVSHIFNGQPFHYTQNDKWSCGFRNLQMIISSMLPRFSPIFPDGVPLINELQMSFELLWAEGFDRDGARHHNSKMVGKTGKISWIGAVEVWSYLSFRGIDSTIVQFANNSKNRSAIGSFVWAYFARLVGPKCECHDWHARLTSYQYAKELLQAANQIRRSDSGETPCLLSCNCTLLPLYLQWLGHSVTIVGIRRERLITSNGIPGIRYHLIVFDPQKSGETLRSKLSNELNKSTSQRQQNCTAFVELSTEKLHTKDTQILLATTRIMGEQEREHCKERVGCIPAVS
ncbi:hypothetical protein HJC23_001182 [Cyclotella cryptica]|uniref:UFSP1/2/DUB catalytic domain-containing protein n=1 Tax=Cyclotella cryptica TaxID=29204 RepID=A0ABD3QQ93_9STRA|eukprot:CCRYP_003815-RA/>CCRYP_003815-RA protein AED:0.05 eAED:0.05 QI:0/-1/0/1/-1/1/1/0/524